MLGPAGKLAGGRAQRVGAAGQVGHLGWVHQHEACPVGQPRELMMPLREALTPRRDRRWVATKRRGSLEVLEVDILWPRWVARIGVTRSTQACFLAADRQCTEPGALFTRARDVQTGLPGESEWRGSRLAQQSQRERWQHLEHLECSQ